MSRRRTAAAWLRREIDFIRDTAKQQRGNWLALARYCSATPSQTFAWFNAATRMPSAPTMLRALRWAEEKKPASDQLRYFPAWSELHAMANTLIKVEGRTPFFSRLTGIDRRRISSYFGRKAGNLIPDGEKALLLLAWLSWEFEEHDDELNFPLAHYSPRWWPVVAVLTSLQMLRGAREGETGRPHVLYEGQLPWGIPPNLASKNVSNFVSRKTDFLT